MLSRFMCLFFFILLASSVSGNEQFNIGEEAYKKSDFILAFFAFKKAAEQGVVDAKRSLGFMYFNGLGAKKNDEKAVSWYREAAEQGDDVAQYELANLYAGGYGLRKDYVQAATWYRKAAEQGLAIAQFRLGLSYEFGYGVGIDFRQSVFWHRKAAEQGHPMGLINLGLMYKNGTGVNKDLVKAQALFNKVKKLSGLPISQPESIEHQ